MNWDEYYMRLAYLVARKSKDPSTRIGSVIVKNNNIISTGYNGIPRGVLDPCDGHDHLINRTTRPEKYHWFAHSERNSIYFAARNGAAIEGATLYTLGVPCSDCGIAIIQSGIKRVIVHKQWGKEIFENWEVSQLITKQMFSEAGVVLEFLDQKLNEECMISGKNFVN